MSKRPSIDLLALTSEPAAPLPEAVQRIPSTTAKPSAVPSARPAAVKTEHLHGLAFKVPRDFRKRFRQRAANADMKLNELLFEALAAWEEKHGIKR